MSADEMPAGRELDALVAERVMGADVSIAPMHTWELNADGTIDTVAWDSDYHNGPSCTRCGYSFCIHCEGETAYTAAPCQVEPPRYSTNITAAWQVVERMRNPDFRLNKDGDWGCSFGGELRFVGLADTAALAICRAALKAVGGAS